MFERPRKVWEPKNIADMEIIDLRPDVVIQLDTPVEPLQSTLKGRYILALMTEITYFANRQKYDTLFSVEDNMIYARVRKFGQQVEATVCSINIDTLGYNFASVSVAGKAIADMFVQKAENADLKYAKTIEEIENYD